MQNVDLRIKSYKQFLVKHKSGAAKKNFSLIFFTIEFFFYLCLQVSEHSMS